MKREFLKELGIEDEVIDKIMDENGKDIEGPVSYTHLRACRGNGLILLLGNTKSTLERNILEPMRNLWTPALVGNISSNNTVNLFGRKCYALGADKVSQVTKIQGAGIEDLSLIHI